ncbi:MAG: T9SS type A sorting domain-containing protein [bacterium]|nr:T9SS type A sorting domain-containing protein [bacterium]
MKTLLTICMAVTLLCFTVPGWADGFYADGPNAPRLYELRTQIDDLTQADEYNEAIWTEFQNLLGNASVRDEGGSLDQGGDDIASATVISGIPYDAYGTTCGYANNYEPYCDNANSRGKDVVYSLTPSENMAVDISLCDPYTNYDTKLYVYKNSTSNRVACDNNGCPGSLASSLDSLALVAGNTYYIVVDGYGTGTCGNYRLQIGQHPLACDVRPDGITDNGNGTFTYRQTTDENSDSPYYDGPFWKPSDCGVGSWAGFEYYSAHDQDYGWKHSWSDWNNPNLNVLSVQVRICAWDIDEYTCNIDNPGHPERCELDHIYADSTLQNPEWLSGDNNTWSLTVFDVAPGALLDDGWLRMWININVHGSECWSTTLNWSQLVVVYAVEEEENNPPYTPTGDAYPECVDQTTAMCAIPTGPDPADPDGDQVTYQYRWFVKNSGTGGGFVNDELNPLFPYDHTESCVPADHSFPGDQWRVQVYAVDEDGALSLEPWIVTFNEIIVDCGEPWPYTDVDMGDLAMCSYPTLVNNPGHGLSGIAWLGANISPEAAPATLDNDLFDDGVTPFGTFWVPCFEESVQVVITAGQNYNDYLEEDGVLYLNAWKDGNLDGDFCDRYPCYDASVSDEWIIHDELVTPGTRVFRFIDPGIIEDVDPYDAVLRFRLTSRPVGRYGFGLIDTVACPGMSCGVFADDFLGEVEDYIWTDFQLSVELGNFDAVGDRDLIALRWSTRSETGNDHFEILRDGAKIAEVSSQGDTPTGHAYAWTDYAVQNGAVYTYTLVGVSLSGARTTLATVSASPADLAGTVTEYALYQNYPNPFNPTTTIAFDLAEAGFVSLKIYNLQGQEIATVVNGNLAAVAHTASFDASSLPSGMYWYKLTANDFTAVRKMTLMK